MSTFFTLLSFADFGKRTVFLMPDQAGWSQYAIYLFPYLYYFISLLLPWALTRLRRGLTRRQALALSMVGLMLLNTWMAQDTSLIAKGVATALLIIPWTMIAVATDHPEAATPVGRVLILMGVLNVLYGAWQFSFGPTPIEVNWARASGEFSIGADHILAFLSDRYGGVNVYRPFGLQADAFTFALFNLNALALAWMLRLEKSIQAGAFYLIALLLLSGILLSLVRTVWVAALGLIMYFLLARRYTSLAKPSSVMGVMFGAFLAAALIAALLYPLKWLAGMVSNPLLARALTFGTLEARMGSMSAFWESLPRFLFSGYGLAASPWMTSKFGGFQGLPLNFGEHNVLVEYLWYVGLPGLVLFFVIIYFSLQSVWKAYRSGNVSADFMALCAAYLLAMYVTGLGNGGVFLNMYFFFITGYMLGLNVQRRKS